MTAAPCSVVHFELPYRDGARVSRFYQAVFGWQLQPLGPEMGNYILATTAMQDNPTPGAWRGSINGGLFPLVSDAPLQHPSVVVGVPDVRAAMVRVTEAGGEVLGEPMTIPGVGDYVSFADTEGNRLSMLQPLDGCTES